MERKAFVVLFTSASRGSRWIQWTFSPHFCEMGVNGILISTPYISQVFPIFKFF